MAITEARKKANAKYEAKAYDKTLIRLPKGRLDEIRAYIKQTSETLNGFINRAISAGMKNGGNGEAATSDQPGNESPLSAETLEKARKSAERTGETLTDFLARAVEMQSQRDGRSLMMGINPAEKK